MANVTFNAELGFGILAIDGENSLSIIRTNAAPDGTSFGQLEAQIGSLLLRENGQIYNKIANGGIGSDWKRLSTEDADDIFLTSSFVSTTTGAPLAGDSLEIAISKLLKSQDDLLTTVGVSRNDVDMGTFTGTVISDNASVKTALQELETFAENISGGAIETASGVTATQNFGLTNVDDEDYCEYEVVLKETANPENKRVLKIGAVHDGSPSADATVVDINRFSRLRAGSNFNVQVASVLTGSGASQQYGISVTSSEPSGVDVKVRKVCL